MTFGLAGAGEALVDRDAVEHPTFGVAVGIGYEDQTSPLVRVTPEGTLIRLDGVDRLSGSHVHGSIGGVADLQFSPESRLALGGDLRFKRAPRASVFDFASIAFNPMLRTSLFGGQVGIGRNLQRLDVAGQRFRRVYGTIADWTLGELDGSHWLVLVDRSRNRHWNEFSDFDSTATQLLFKRHVVRPGLGLDAIEAEVVLARERNDQGFAELSSKSALVRVGIEFSLFGVEAGVGLARHTSRFDDTALPDEPRRRDLATTLDVSLSYELQPRHALKLDFLDSTNDANVALYENRYRMLSLAYSVGW